jgi:DNA-binding LytR/AlgR family response regulator
MAVRTRCLVVDDEPLARRVLARHIRALPWLELAGECGNAQAAAAWLHDHSVDVMFLDIRMPGLTGLELLATLPHPPQVILTTAYSEYALVSYEYGVVDYLLKPISFERFLAAVNKLGSIPGQPEATTRSGVEKPDSIFLRVNRKDHKVRFAEIRFLEGYGNYVKVHLERETVLVAETMTRLEQTLPAEQFLRVHKSYIVALDRIERFGTRSVCAGDVEIPVGRSYRRRVGEILQQRLGDRR